MQTFLSNISFKTAAAELDSTRLNSQVNEALIILRTLTGWYEARSKKGWPNHTVTRMWAGYEPALFEYILNCLNECGLRHISVYTISERTEKALDALKEKATLFFEWYNNDYEYPPWLTEEFASNHRAILLGKVYEAYDIAFINDKNILKASKQLDWYRDLQWSEKPAKRNEDGKWPFLWPEVVK